MDGEPTTGWYSTRVELALAIGLVLWIALSLAFPPHFMGGPPEPPPIWMQLVPIAGFLGMLFGLGLDGPHPPRSERRAAALAPPGPLTALLRHPAVTDDP